MKAVTPPPDTSTPAPMFHLGHPDHHLPRYELPENASKPPGKILCLVGFLIAALVATGGAVLRHFGDGAPNPTIAIVWAIPLILLLGAIAILPFVAKALWEKYYHYISIALGLIVVGYYLLALGATATVAATFADYISFIFLLGSLYVVSGGIVIRIHCKAGPAANIGLLIAGAILANIVGTTGASMLLIRPYLRLNRGR